MPKETFSNLPEDKRSRLVNEMIAAFASHRYADVSVSAITNAAGISKGSFYQYFDNKEDAYRYVITLAVAKRSENQELSSDGTVASTLKQFRDQSNQLATEHPALYAILSRAMTDPGAPAIDLAKDLSQAVHARLVSLLEYGRHTGELRPELDTDLAAFLVETAFANFGDYLIKRFHIADTDLQSGTAIFAVEEISQVIEELTDLLLRALMPHDYSQST